MSEKYHAVHSLPLHLKASKGYYYSDSDHDTDKDGSNYDFRGNPYLLQIAFLNLMENSCKYSTDNYCNVEMESKNNDLTIRFIDKGIGIPEDQEKIFDLFYRGNNKISKKVMVPDYRL